MKPNENRAIAGCGLIMFIVICLLSYAIYSGTFHFIIAVICGVLIIGGSIFFIENFLKEFG